MIAVAEVEPRRIPHSKKSDIAPRLRRSNPTKTAYASVPWSHVRSEDGEAAIVLSSGLCEKHWERLDSETRALIYQLTLSKAGESHPFTINFDRNLVLKALTSKKPFSSWANERLSYHLGSLEERYGYRLPFWFTVEISKTGVYHLHGAIGINDNQRAEVERLLKRAAGSSNTGAHKWFVRVKDFDPQKHFNSLYGSLGWAAYSVKELGRTEDFGIGSPLVCRRELNARARDGWNVLRREYRRRSVEALLERSVSEPAETAPDEHSTAFVGMEPFQLGYHWAMLPVAL